MSGMSESVYETPVNEIMDRLMETVTKGWRRESLGSPYTTWVFSKMTISDLEGFAGETLSNEDLVNLLAHLAYLGTDNLSLDKEEFRKEFVRLWNKLTLEQKHAFLINLYRNVALDGLRDFLDIVGEDLNLKDVEDYLNGKISFSDLMYTLVEKYGLNLEDYHNEEVESFLDGVYLADYVDDEDLKELVRKHVLPKVEKHK